MLDARRALVFAAVVEAGSFSAAADALHLTQPSVSRAVAELERALGLTLLHRRRDGLVLTQAGERLLERVRAAGGELEAADAELAALRSLAEGRVRLGAFPTAARTLAVDAIRTLHAAHPGLRVELRELPGSGAASLVAAGALDVAVQFDLAGEPPELDAQLEVTELLREPLRLAVPVSHRLAGRRRVRLGELRDEPWVQGAGPGAPRLVERVARRAGFEPRVVAEADGTQGMVAAGLGITLLPALAAPRDDVAVVELADAPLREVYALSLAGAEVPAVAALLDALRTASARKSPTTSK